MARKAPQVDRKRRIVLETAHKIDLDDSLDGLTLLEAIDFLGGLQEQYPDAIGELFLDRYCYYDDQHFDVKYRRFETDKEMATRIKAEEKRLEAYLKRKSTLAKKAADKKLTSEAEERKLYELLKQKYEKQEPTAREILEAKLPQKSARQRADEAERAGAPPRIRKQGAPYGTR